MNTSNNRRLRAFKRWMSEQNIDYSNTLILSQKTTQHQNKINYNNNTYVPIYIKTIHNLTEGDLVATIPKQSCLTLQTSYACNVFDETTLFNNNNDTTSLTTQTNACKVFDTTTLFNNHNNDTNITNDKEKTKHFNKKIEKTGLFEEDDDDEEKKYVALAMVIMYEKSLKESSKWYPYLELMPVFEPIPVFWSDDEVDLLLSGTELYKIIKEDKVLFHEQWEKYILPLVSSDSLKLDSGFFSVENYFAARSLISSRSFQIDDYHGFGMVPLADLFNHKTGAENVHITSSSSSHPTLESDAEDNETIDEDESPGNDTELFSQSSPSGTSHSDDASEASSSSEGDPTVLEIIVVKAVESGSEVFNTYGSLGNAGLLHRYGFTELDNPYDIVNIDLELVLEWSSSLFSTRHSKARLSLWRKLDYLGCTSNSDEYFEVSFDGEPQIELLVLLYILLLPEEAFFKLDLTMSTAVGTINGSLNSFTLLKDSLSKLVTYEFSKMSDKERRNMVLTESVRDALVSLANIREGLYGSSSIEDDITELEKCCTRERKLYHSLILRISERKILQKLREYAMPSVQLSKKSKKKVVNGKRLKRSST